MSREFYIKDLIIRLDKTQVKLKQTLHEWLRFLSLHLFIMQFRAFYDKFDIYSLVMNRSKSYYNMLISLIAIKTVHNDITILYLNKKKGNSCRLFAKKQQYPLTLLRRYHTIKLLRSEEFAANNRLNSGRGLIGTIRSWHRVWNVQRVWFIEVDWLKMFNILFCIFTSFLNSFYLLAIQIAIWEVLICKNTTAAGNSLWTLASIFLSL